MSAPYPLVHSHLLVKRLLSLNKPKSLAPALHYVYMTGETVQCRHDTDRELPFRQESNFAWLSGCDVPGSALTIAYEHDGSAEVDTAKIQTRLWLPEIDDAEVMWCGLPPAPEELAKSLHLTSIQHGWTPAARQAAQGSIARRGADLAAMASSPGDADHIPLLNRSLPPTPAPDASDTATDGGPGLDEARAGLLRHDYNEEGKDRVDEEQALPPLPVSGKKSWRRLIGRIRFALLVTAILAMLGALVFLFIFPALGSLWSKLNPWATGPRTPEERFFEPPSHPLDPEKIWRQEAVDGENYTVTAIVIHGLGDFGNGAPFVWEMPIHFPYVRWVAPTADQLNVTVRKYKTDNAWFDMESFPDVYYHEDVEGYVHSQRQLNLLIDEERARMIELGKEPRILVMGFSQGGVMTLLLSLTAPADRIEAAIVFSTYLPMMDRASEWIGPASQSMPILWMHGKDDPYLTEPNAELGVATLLKPPISHSALQYRKIANLGHTYTDDEVLEATDWLKQYVGREKGTLDPIDVVADREPGGVQDGAVEEGGEAQNETADIATG